MPMSIPSPASIAAELRDRAERPGVQQWHQHVCGRADWSELDSAADPRCHGVQPDISNNTCDEYNEMK